MGRTKFAMSVMAVLALAGCTKNTEQLPPPGRGVGTTKGLDCASYIKGDACGQMLSFASAADFEETYNCLESANEAWLDAFEAQYANLTDEQFDDLRIASGLLMSKC